MPKIKERLHKLEKVLAKKEEDNLTLCFFTAGYEDPTEEELTNCPEMIAQREKLDPTNPVKIFFMECENCTLACNGNQKIQDS